MKVRACSEGFVYYMYFTPKSLRPDDSAMVATISVLPVRRVLFPMQVATYAISKRSSVALIERLLDALGQPFGPLDDLARSSSAALLAVSLAKPDEEPPIYRVGTAVRLLEVRAVTQAMVGAGAVGSGLSAAVYVIVVQGVERVTLEPAGATAQEMPYLRLTARRVEPGPELDHESATTYGLALQSLAQEVPSTAPRPARATALSECMRRRAERLCPLSCLRCCDCSSTAP